MTDDGKQEGETTFNIRLPESLRLAAESLQRIGQGRGTQADIAELMLAANMSGKSVFQGVVGAAEITRAILDLSDLARVLAHAQRWDEYDATMARKVSLEDRYQAIKEG